MATTYNDQKSALDSLTNSLVFENSTRAITGTGHNAQELGQNASMYDNLVANDNYAYKIVRTYATAAANGASLKDAYEDAKTLTPNGSALAINNRVALLIPPGTYAFGTAGLELDTQFIDLIGMGEAEDIILTSVSNTGTGLGTIIQSTNNIIFKSLTIQNTANAFSTGTDQDDSGYAPQGVYPSAVFEDCIFRNPATSGGAPFMRLGFEYSGTFTRCRGIDSTSNSVFFPIASGNYFDCHYSGNGFGYEGEASGIFTDSSCLNGFGYNGDASGSFTRCTAFNSGFGYNANASGNFSYCTALTESFGWGSGVTCSGKFVNCAGVDRCFGNSNNAASFVGCSVGSLGFGLHEDPSSGDNEIAGSYVNCIAGDDSFFGASSLAATVTLSGTFKNCKAGASSFGAHIGGSILTGVFEQCSAGDNSFGQYGCSITGAKFIDCNAGDNSFGYNQPTITNSSFVNCTAGDNSFGWAEFPGSLSSVFGGEFINCTGGNACWAYLNPADGTTFTNCKAGDLSFLADLESVSVALGQAHYVGCVAGDGSFVGTASSSTVKDCLIIAGGGFLDCSGSYSGCRADGDGFNNIYTGASFFGCESGGSGFNFGTQTSVYGTFSVEMKGCKSGDQSFGYVGTSTLIGGTVTISGSFDSCTAGDNSFGCTIGGNSSVALTGKAYNCTAGNFSFCTAIQSPTAGSHTEVLSGYIENCHAGAGSFAAHSTSSKTGTLSGCTVRTNGSPASFADAGPLTGTMTNCQWTVAPASTASLIVATGAKVYGGLYRAGAGATAGIDSSGAATVSIANVLTNVALGGSITNNITSPNIIVDSDI